MFGSSCADSLLYTNTYLDGPCTWRYTVVIPVLRVIARFTPLTNYFILIVKTCPPTALFNKLCDK